MALRHVLIAVGVFSVAIAASGQKSQPQTMKAMPIPPDTFEYRVSSSGWADLVSRDRTILVRHDSETTLTVRDARTDTVIFGIWRPPHSITCYAIGPDDNAIAIGTRDGRVDIWDSRSGACDTVLRPRVPSVDWVYYVWQNGYLHLCVAQLSAGRGWDCFPANKMWSGNAILSGDTVAFYEVAPQPLPNNPQPTSYGDGVGGKVYVQAYVDEHGNVLRWHVVRAVPPGLGFETEAARLIQQWKFTPAMQQDRPIGVWIMVPFTFEPK